MIFIWEGAPGGGKISGESRRYWGNWVDFPEPVSPVITQNYWEGEGGISRGGK